jgi:hypothetical protein
MGGKILDPVLQEVVNKRKVGPEELKNIMKKYGKDPRGIGGFSSSRKIKWNEKENCWEPGPAIYEDEQET